MTLPETIADIVGRGGDADDVLRAVVRALAGTPGVCWAGISFVEGDKLVLGPSAGVPEPARSVRVAIAYRGERVGELEAHGDVTADVLAGIAARVADYVLLGWDTGGEAWEP